MDTNPQGVSGQTAAPTSPLVIQGHVNPTEDDFQGLFDKGAFEPTSNQKPEGQEQQAEGERQEAPANAKPETESDDKAASKDAKPEEDEEPEYASLDDFLTKNKLDPESFNRLAVNVKVNGETAQVPLSDVLRGYQLDKANTQKSQELSEARKALEQERAAQTTLAKQYLTNARALGEQAYQQMMSEFKSINWDHLQATDPINWTVQRQKFQERDAQIRQHMQQVAGMEQQQAEEATQRQRAFVADQRTKMLEKFPEWSDPTKFREAQESMSSYAKNLGFTDDELRQVHDHRMVQVLHEASQYRALQASAKSAVKKVRAAPPMAKPGARQERDPNSVAKQQLRERFLANPRDTDAQEAYFDTLS